MDTQVSNRARFGLLTLALYGLLAIASIVLHGPLADAARDPQGFALAVTAPGFATGFLITMIAQIVEIFSFIALYVYLAKGRSEALGFWGMVLGVSGAGLFLALTGFLALAAPAIGRLYLEGQTGVMQVAVAGFAGGSALVILSVSGLVGTIGTVLIAIALVRSGLAPKVAAALFVLALVLLAFAPAFSYPLELLGGVLALVSGAWIALGAWRQPAPASAGSTNAVHV